MVDLYYGCDFWSKPPCDCYSDMSLCIKTSPKKYETAKKHKTLSPPPENAVTGMFSLKSGIQCQENTALESSENEENITFTGIVAETDCESKQENEYTSDDPLPFSRPKPHSTVQNKNSQDSSHKGLVLAPSVGSTLIQKSVSFQYPEEAVRTTEGKAEQETSFQTKENVAVSGTDSKGSENLAGKLDPDYDEPPDWSNETEVKDSPLVYINKAAIEELDEIQREIQDVAMSFKTSLEEPQYAHIQKKKTAAEVQYTDVVTYRLCPFKTEQPVKPAENSENEYAQLNPIQPIAKSYEEVEEWL
eukprot:m.213477 g.213477  ORF g.213477 m.213477 type:complete len:303 (+) comp39788_c1_seq2:861-1769(+)